MNNDRYFFDAPKEGWDEYNRKNKKMKSFGGKDSTQKTNEEEKKKSQSSSGIFGLLVSLAFVGYLFKSCSS